MTELALIDHVSVGNILGENTLWDDKLNVFLWTDIEGKMLFSYDMIKRKTEKFEMPERLCSFGLTMSENAYELIMAFEKGVYFYDRKTKERRLIQALEEGNSRTRLNDGRVDRQGRFWVGSMVENDAEAGEDGKLYSLDGLGDVRVHEENIQISNSLCWSPDGSVMYFADSADHTIYQYDFKRKTGKISNKSVFVRTDKTYCPDGSAIDERGYLWNACWGSSEVICYHPDGHIVQRIKLPVSQPTCVAFGGENLNFLCVSTARVGLSSDILKREPLAGDVFIFQVNVAGIPESRYQNLTKEYVRILKRIKE